MTNYYLSSRPVGLKSASCFRRRAEAADGWPRFVDGSASCLSDQGRRLGGGREGGAVGAVLPPAHAVAPPPLSAAGGGLPDLAAVDLAAEALGLERPLFSLNSRPESCAEGGGRRPITPAMTRCTRTSAGPTEAGGLRLEAVPRPFLACEGDTREWVGVRVGWDRAWAG